MFPEDQIGALKSVFPVLATTGEGSFTFIQIEDLKLPEGSQPRVVTGLLCPMPRDGYPSRLFLSEKISHSGKGQGWNPQGGCVILGRTWWAVSWKVRADLTLLQMMLDHLGAFRQ